MSAMRMSEDRVWICRDDLGHLHAFAMRPPNPTAIEYMRVLSRDEVEKLANDAEGVDALQWINSLQRTVEGQRKHITRLERQNREDANDAAAEAGWKERQGDEYGSY